jgi:hypothetical protein
LFSTFFFFFFKDNNNAALRSIVQSSRVGTR